MAPGNKRIVGYIKMTIPAGQATPGQPVGPALGQKKVRIPDFVRAFNERTSDMEPGIPVPVEITAYDDGTCAFITKTPPASYLIIKEAGLSKGSSSPGRGARVGKITHDQVAKIAQIKEADLSAASPEAAQRIIAGSARSMGIEVA